MQESVVGFNNMKQSRVLVTGCKKVWFGLEENLIFDSSAEGLILICPEGAANFWIAKYVRF